MTPEDFVTALENFNSFLQFGLTELKDSEFSYPVGVGINGVRVHFMHYSTFEIAISKWNERCSRIDLNNIGIMLTNYADIQEDTRGVIERFDKLPFKHKVIFTMNDHPEFKSAFRLKGLKRGGLKNIYATQYINGKRYIDQFDYVGFINKLTT